MADTPLHLGASAAVILAQNRQQRRERLQAEQLTGLSRLLLPSALAIARLAAWDDVRRVTR